METIT